MRGLTSATTRFMVFEIIQPQREVYIFLKRVWLHQLNRLLHESDNVRRLEFVLLAALLDARKVQNVFDERRKSATFLADETKIFLLLFRRGNFPTLQTFR